MQICDVPSATLVGEVKESSKLYKGSRYVLYSSPLELVFDSAFPKEMRTKHVSLIYIFCVDGEIYKIGQSSCASGIAGCMGFYMGAGMDDPGINRFAINWLIREVLKEGKKVEVYMLWSEPILVEVPGLFASKEMLVPVSAKGMEENCLSQFHAIEGKYPDWNYQETHTCLPNDIHIAFAEYKKDRKEKSR